MRTKDKEKDVRALENPMMVGEEQGKIDTANTVPVDAKTNSAIPHREPRLSDIGRAKYAKMADSGNTANERGVEIRGGMMTSDVPSKWLEELKWRRKNPVD